MPRLVRYVDAKLVPVPGRRIGRDRNDIAENKSVVVVIPVAGVVSLRKTIKSSVSRKRRTIASDIDRGVFGSLGRPRRGEKYIRFRHPSRERGQHCGYDLFFLPLKPLRRRELRHFHAGNRYRAMVSHILCPAKVKEHDLSEICGLSTRN